MVKNISFIKSEETSICPICGGSLYVIGSKPRKVIETAGETKTLIIRRLRCVECNKIHHELPDILIPYKRHCAETIENIISGKMSQAPCEESAIRRIKAWRCASLRTWRAALQLYFQMVPSSLNEKYGTAFSSATTPKQIVRAVANAHLWIHTQDAWRAGAFWICATL